MIQKIGTSVLVYDNLGKLKSATFTPEMDFVADESLISKLSKIKHKSEAEIKSDAETIMASWFNQLNTIELADRDEYEVVGQKEDCVYNGKGSVKTIKISFYFKKRSEQLNNN